MGFASVSTARSVIRIISSTFPDVTNFISPEAAARLEKRSGSFFCTFGILAARPYIKSMSRYDYEKLAVIHPAGTVLETDAYGVIRHVGIATGYGTVIHASRRYGGVLETSEKQFSRGKPIRIIPHRSPLSGTELVVRARQKLGQRYGVLTRNCEHFVQWVVAGEPRSEQLGPLDLSRL